jgi:hypothetical protein
MAHCNTILSQPLKFVPRHEFETLAQQHHSGGASRTASRWSNFLSLTMAQLSWRNSSPAFPWADFRTTKGAVKLHAGLKPCWLFAGVCEHHEGQ